MKGHVPTPEDLAKRTVQGLFEPDPPSSGDQILYPGIGTAPFAAAVERVCDDEGWTLPEGLGVELDPAHLTTARERDLDHVEFEEWDFLKESMLSFGEFDYIVGNPPYVPIEGVDDEKKPRFREQFDTATGRFDLYLLFFEQALNLLALDGWLVFITPEKFEYVDAAGPLRAQLTDDNLHVKQIDHIDEDAFKEDITFPCVTTVYHQQGLGETTTRVFLRDESTHTVELPAGRESWASSIRGNSVSDLETGITLGDVTERISPGTATGADAIFVNRRDQVPKQLKPDWVYPTVSGRQLSENDGPQTNSVFVCPYQNDGALPGKDELGVFGDWAEFHRPELKDRTCVQKDGDKWYAWHENPPMEDLLQSKIVFKDIAKKPQFWAERKGNVIPRHSVYYLIPKDENLFNDILEYLNSTEARVWIEANCQKATNGFLRLQTRVLEDLPVPTEWAENHRAHLDRS